MKFTDYLDNYIISKYFPDPSSGDAERHELMVNCRDSLNNYVESLHKNETADSQKIIYAITRGQHKGRIVVIDPQSEQTEDMVQVNAIDDSKMPRTMKVFREWLTEDHPDIDMYRDN